MTAALLLQAAAAPVAAAPAVDSAIGKPNVVAMSFFFAFIAITLGITYWAARRTRTAEQFYAAGRTVSAGQNGLALAGDYMSAAGNYRRYANTAGRFSLFRVVRERRYFITETQRSTEGHRGRQRRLLGGTTSAT